MPKNISWRKLVARFRSLGFDGPYSGGRHLFMVKGALKVRIPNPHRGYGVDTFEVDPIIKEIGDILLADLDTKFTEYKLSEKTE